MLSSIKTYVDEIRSGKKLGATGKPIVNVLAVGIGGSQLGPEFVNLALEADATAKAGARGRTLRFLANVDPVDASNAFQDLDPEATMVIVVSKTFTTAETMMNAKTARAWLVAGNPNADPSKVVSCQFAAVSTAIDKAVGFGIDKENIFGFWDWVGGRYSVTSAVGMLPLSLHYGYDVMNSFLEGAHDIDNMFFDTSKGNIKNNMPVILGLLGVWNSTFLGHGARALLPYSQALRRLPAHIQQVDMESNGKGVAMDGSGMEFDCGEINFGEAGTNGQHSFYQLMHQGRVVPCDFIGFKESQQPKRLAEGEAVVSNHDELMSNFFAQPDALACGKTLADCEKEGIAEKVSERTFATDFTAIIHY